MASRLSEVDATHDVINVEVPGWDLRQQAAAGHRWLVEAAAAEVAGAADLEAFSLVRDDGDEIALTDAGAYWLHVVQDVFSIDGVGKLWSAAMREPWPKAVAL